MDLSVHEIEIPIPISSSNYVEGGSDSHGQSQSTLPPFHLHHHHHQHLSNGPPPPSLPLQSPSPLSFSLPLLGQRTVSVKYRECLKNHAASIGGNATDGCGEFMPSGEEGTIEALKCSACACHRNFHRKEIDGDRFFNHRASGKKFMGQKSSVGFNTGGGIDSLILSSNPSDHHNQMIMPFASVHTSDSEERPPPPPPMAKKKRFRTRFTAEQKEKMLCFAEKAGWRLQKQEESVVQQLCSEIGVKRRVLKVWMHNNKHNLAKKTSNLQLQ